MPLIVIAAVALLVGADQLIKLWASQSLSAVGSIPVIDGVFAFSYVENRGAAFGILQDQRWIFIVLTILVILAAIWLLFSGRVNRWMVRIPIILALAGGIGNLIDRIFHGYVVDMFYFELIDFAVFNFADVCVVVGCIWLVLSILFVPDAIRWRGKAADREGEDRGEAHSDSH